MQRRSLKYFVATPLRRDIVNMLAFGALSLLFGSVKFYVPGVEGAFSDLREIPMVLGAYHMINPVFAIGLGVIGSLNTPPEASYLSTVLFHAIALLVTSFVFKYVKKQEPGAVGLSLFGFIYTFAYYIFLIIPLLNLTGYLVGFNLDKGFIALYKSTLFSLRFEMLSTSIIVALYLLQDRFRQSLRKYSENLETLAEERTKHLDEAIKELKLRQQQLVQSEKMASIGSLTSGVAHEINNPLNFISGGIFMLEKIDNDINQNEPSKTKESYASALQMISTGLSRISNVVKALASFSRKAGVQTEKTDIHTIIDNTLLFIHKDISNRIHVEKNFELDQPIPIYPEKIHQVLINLLNNAYYELNREEGDGRKLAINTKKVNGKAVIEVFNSGSKIDDEHIGKIFDPFFTTKNPDEGTGLGLSISYMIIKEHNGSLTAENLGDGVQFTICLPLA